MKPWREKSWCIPKPSARFVARMEDVLDVYRQPYDPQRPMICLDEISTLLTKHPRGQLAMEPAEPKRVDYAYEKQGSCNIFLAVEPLTGHCHTWVTQQRTYDDFALVLEQLLQHIYADTDGITLVTDNLNIHDPACLYQHFSPQKARQLTKRIDWHFTPVHASWLNIAEIELSVLRRQALGRSLATQEQVEKQVLAWTQQRNQSAKHIDWRFTTDDARIKLKRLYPIVNVHNVT